MSNGIASKQAPVQATHLENIREPSAASPWKKRCVKYSGTKVSKSIESGELNKFARKSSHKTGGTRRARHPDLSGCGPTASGSRWRHADACDRASGSLCPCPGKWALRSDSRRKQATTQKLSAQTHAAPTPMSRMPPQSCSQEPPSGPVAKPSPRATLIFVRYPGRSSVGTISARNVFAIIQVPANMPLAMRATTTCGKLVLNPSKSCAAPFPSWHTIIAARRP
mmetsp:Transcript_20949/g.60482  ORF Transcript_20949/g.60482 Transcript_20949/m.60482 type:complete len:224 (+) Transcript_20949:560-1231(+)